MTFDKQTKYRDLKLLPQDKMDEVEQILKCSPHLFKMANFTDDIVDMYRPLQFRHRHVVGIRVLYKYE